MNERWRDKPRISILIAGLPWAIAAALLLWALAFKARDTLGLGFGPSGSHFVLGLYLLLFCGWASLALQSVARHRAWQRIITSDFNACPYCEYPLRGLPAAARCPECGEPYNTEKVQEHWKECFETAAKTEACLRLSPSSMQRYTRYSIWMFLIAGVCIGLGLLNGFYRFIPGRITGAFFMFAGFALLIAQQTLLIRTIRKFWDGEMKR